jgi:hypothetical protein
VNLRFTNSFLATKLELPIHPYTGLRAIGIGKRGPIWPVMGGAEDGDADQDADDSDESDDSEDDSGDDSEDTDSQDQDSKGKKKKKTDDDERVYTANEYNRLKARMQAADRRATDTQKQLKALEDKDKPADVKMKADLEEALKKLEDLKAARQKDLIQLAFLRSNDVQWHDPEDALTMADLSDVEIDDDGNVDKKALKAALRDLAKRKPHLVKQSKKDNDDDDEEEEEENGDQRSSGSKMAGNRKGNKGKGPSRDDLAKKFPALRRR